MIKLRQVYRTTRHFIDGGSARLLAYFTLFILLSGQAIHMLHTEIMPHRAYLTTDGLFVRDRFEMLEALPDDAVYAHYRELQGLKILRADSDENSVVLTVLNNGTYMFLAGRQQLRDVDIRLLPFYQAQTMQDARAILGQFGVTHVYTNPVAFPTRTQSYLDAILQDASQSTLIYDSAMVQVYRLEPN